MQLDARFSDPHFSKRRLVCCSNSHSIRILICTCGLVLFSAFTSVGAAQNGQNPCKSIHDPSLTALPDANKQMEMRQQQTAKKDYAAANVERKKQIADDSAKLLKLATDLKAQVDKTTKDTLSLDVIRKADEIEKLAHNVKEKMKLSVGGN